MPTQSIAVRDGNNTAQSIAVQVDNSNIETYVMSTDRVGAAMYRASASFTPQATAAVTVLSIQGSATKTVRVRRLEVSGVSTANASVIMRLIRSSALGAGGTTVNPTVAKLDPRSAAATAVVAHYTTTLKAAGTSTDGPLTTHRLFTSVVTTPTITPVRNLVFPEAGVPVGQSIVLNGTADFLEYQLVGGGNLSAGTVLEYVIEWEEDGS